MQIRRFQESDREAVIALWRASGLVKPWNDPDRDIDRKIAHGVDEFLVGVSGDTLIATVMGGYEGHRGWINYLAVSETARGRGHARALMTAVESRLIARGCPKINLQVRETNETVLAFYRHLGYRVDESVSLGKRLIPDGPSKHAD